MKYQFRILTTLFLALFTGLICEAGLTPSFFRVGGQYEAESLTFEVIQIGEEGWIQVRSDRDTFWLNTNLLQIVREMDSERMKSRQAEDALKETMADMRAIATACESYAVDNNNYPAAGSVRELATVLQPTYIRKLPQTDSWNNEYTYKVDASLQEYWIVSYGSDGRKEESAYNSDGTPHQVEETTTAGADIIFSNGTFVRYPKDASN